VTVTFTPTATGNRTGNVTVTAPGFTTLVIPLSGTGTAPGQSPLGFGFYRFENGKPGSVASGNGSILDSSAYGNKGTPVGSPTYSSDVPSTGSPNSVSLQFNGGSDAVTFGTTFPFNQPGLDVSLDFWLKIPPTSLHEFIFWTRLDTSDTDRFNVYVNYNGQLALDYRDPGGSLHALVGSWYDGVPIPTNTWTHFNITRLGNEYYVTENGTLMATAVDSSPDLPNDMGWMISSSSCCGLDALQGWLDEVNLSPAGAGIDLSGNSLVFGNQPLGTTSATQSITLSSTGETALNITSIAASGDFAETNTCGATVASGASCTITVTFTPTANGTRTGPITITDNAPGSPQVITLTGTGTAPAVTLSASTLSVGNQAVGVKSDGHTITLTNSGNGVLAISGIAVSGDFGETDTCGSSVAAGASCAINVTFTPTAPGTRTGTITITDNAPGSPHVVSLTGTGTGPAVSFSGSTMPVGAQIVGTTSAAHAFTLTNSGNAALNITGMTLSPASFSETNTCGTSLAAGANCTITVKFTPTTGGEITGMLSVTDNAVGSPHQVVLSGMGQDFTIGPYNLAHTMPVGFTAVYYLQVAPEGGFNQTVSLACSGAPQQSSCSVTPASTTL
jgi:hypothetical protein